MWTSVEDYLMSSFLSFVQEQEVTHLSLHNDGFRVAMRVPIGDTDDFSVRCSEHAGKDTGFIVNLRLKDHVTFFAAVIMKATESGRIDGFGDIFLRPGNCIPAAVAHLQENAEDWHIRLSDGNNPKNVQAANRKVRSYKEVAEEHALIFTASKGLEIEDNGDYVIHAEYTGVPHAIALRRDGENAIIFDKNYRFEITCKDHIMFY